MDEREQLQRELAFHAGLCANDGNGVSEDFWRHQLHRIKEKAEEKQGRPHLRRTEGLWL